MDSWAAFPVPIGQSPTAQPLQAHPPRYPFTSAQQTTNMFIPPHSPNLSHYYPVPVPQDTRVASVSDTDLTAAAMNPTPKRRKKKAPTLRAKDWEPYKARILELHIAQNLPLTKVKEMIEEEFDFNAEVRQYRTRITQWGKDKKIKPAEMTAIVRKRQQRKLVEVDKGEQIFSVRGRNVEPHKIDRWMVRHGVSQNSLYAPSPIASTPSEIICHTVSECGPATPSPTYSTRSLNFSPRTVISIASSPTTPQPVSPIPSAYQSPASDDMFFNQPPRRYRQEEEEAAREALSVAESSFGAYHSQTLRLRIKLGGILVLQGRYSHAEEIARRAVEDCEKFGNSLTIKFDALQLLSEVLHLQGSRHQSRKLQEWLLEWRKVSLGEEHPSTVRNMMVVTWEHLKNGNSVDAENLCVQALEISQRTFGEFHPDTLRATNLLVHTYSEQGRLDEAERLGEQMLRMTKAELGNRHMATIDCMSRLALIYHRQGRSNEAGELLRQTLEMSVDLLGADHPMTIYDRRNLSEQYKSQGRLEDAQDLAEQALMVAQMAFGKQHSETVEPMTLLIEIYEDQGQIAKAEELKQQKQELERRELEGQEDMGLDFSYVASWFSSLGISNFIQTREAGDGHPT